MSSTGTWHLAEITETADHSHRQYSPISKFEDENGKENFASLRTEAIHVRINDHRKPVITLSSCVNTTWAAPRHHLPRCTIILKIK